jgi:hypothetical protein
MKELSIIILCIYLSGYFISFLMLYILVYGEYTDQKYKNDLCFELELTNFVGFALFSLLSWFSVLLVMIKLIFDLFAEHFKKYEPE